MNIHQVKHYLENLNKFMKTHYYYLLFRIHTHYLDKDKNNLKETLYRVTISSTLIIFMLILTILAIVDFYFFKIVNQILPNKFAIIIFMTIIALLNYWYFIKNIDYLNYSFKTDKKGGYSIIIFILLLALTFVFIANKNSRKVLKLKEKQCVENTNIN